MIFLLPALLQACASGQAVKQIQKFPTTISAYKTNVSLALERTFVGQIKSQTEDREYVEPYVGLKIQRTFGVLSFATTMGGVVGFMYAANNDNFKGLMTGLVATGVGFGGIATSLWLHTKQYEMLKKVRSSQK